jgi:hypothetical protein
MRSIFAALFALAAAAPSVPGPTRAPKVEPSAEFREIGDLLVGRWMFEQILDVDYPGLGKKGDKFSGQSICRYAADGAAIECDDFGGPTSAKKLWVWNRVNRRLEMLAVDSGGNWDEGYEVKQGPKLIGKSSGNLGDGSRVESLWETVSEKGGRLQRTSGTNIINGVRNSWRSTATRVDR